VKTPRDRPDSDAPMGVVSLVGAGPGDPELLTYRAMRRLREADLVLYDGLVPSAVADLASGARRVSVAKRAGRASTTQAEVTGMMIAAARRGDRVVRLKAGDPFVLGRGGEEAAALAAAGVPFEVVPGVTSALAAPALAGIAVTHRGLTSAFLVLSGHQPEAYTRLLGSIPPASATIVVLMGLAERAGISTCLVDAGWDDDTPSAVVINASQPDQSVWVGTLRTLGTAPAPADDEAGVIVIGPVVSAATAPSLAFSPALEETAWQPTTIPRR